MGVVTSLDCLSGSQHLSFCVLRKSLSVEYHTSREYVTRTMTVGLLALWTNGHGPANPSYHSANRLFHKISSNEGVCRVVGWVRRAMTVGPERGGANGHGSSYVLAGGMVFNT